jgi:phosphoglycerate dehydrogenase-like enzyme
LSHSLLSRSSSNIVGDESATATGGRSIRESRTSELVTEPTPNIVVLRAEAHGLSAVEYAAALRNQLPEYEIEYARTPARERALVPEAPIVTGQTISEDLLNCAENLRLFAGASAGTGHLPLEALANRGVTVTNASGIHAPNVAEHVLGCMLLFARRLDEGVRLNQRSEWRHIQAYGELRGSTATVVGLGNIGRAVVQRLTAFDLDTIGVRYTPSKGGPTDEVIGFDPDPFHDALARTDYLVLSCPLTETTRGLVDADAFETLPIDAVVVNVARGAVIDTDALTGALRGNAIHAAALDVTNPEPIPEGHPFWTLENCLVTPHVSGHTWEYWTRLADILARNVRRIEESEEYVDLENQVLSPEDET